ncbi:MAG: zinc metalloprotease HtpX [Mariprofundus sp.]|nr:zinc metalloprotease HtpX [Mariprofundus sp.]
MTHSEVHKQRNALHTMIIFVAMFALILVLGYSLFGLALTMIMLVFSAVLLMLLPQAPAWLSLRLHRAQALSYRQAPALYDQLAYLSRRAGLAHLPELYLIPSERLNAFAMQERGKPLIALTSGMLDSMTRRELAAVMGHEIGHIRNADLYVMMLAGFFHRITTMLSYAGMILIVILLPLGLLVDGSLPVGTLFLLLLAPSLSTLLQLALSRTREFDADVEASSLTGDPLALASALQRIEYFSQPWWRQLLPGCRYDATSWWRTHPATDERIERLQQMAQDYRLDEHNNHADAFGMRGCSLRHPGFMQSVFMGNDMMKASWTMSRHAAARLWR